MTLNDPLNRRPMYCCVEAADALIPGCGASGLALGTRPFPLATSSCFPSGVTRTDVGYQPVGMNPNERLRPGVLTSNTARVLLSAFAMNRVRSSGVSARLLGVDPGGASG